MPNYRFEMDDDSIWLDTDCVKERWAKIRLGPKEDAEAIMRAMQAFLEEDCRFASIPGNEP